MKDTPTQIQRNKPIWGLRGVVLIQIATTSQETKEISPKSHNIIHSMSVIMEETSRGWGSPTGYRKPTAKEIKEADKDFAYLEKKYGIKFYD